MLRRVYRIICGLLITAALIIGFYYLWNKTSGYYYVKAIRYFSYFTHISNIGVMLWYFLNALYPYRSAFYTKPFVRGGLMTYILVTGIIFFSALLPQMRVSGLELINSFILHGISPILFFLDYLLFETKGIFSRRWVVTWLYIPLFYLIWTLVLSLITGSAPYPFLDIHLIGVNKLFMWTVAFIFIFLAAAAFVVFLDRTLGTPKNGTKTPQNRGNTPNAE